MNVTPTKDKIVEELRRVKTPDGRGDIVRQGLISEIVLQDGKVYFSIAVPPDQAGAHPRLDRQVHPVEQHHRPVGETDLLQGQDRVRDGRRVP